jgi:RNA polymerase sigma-70 factor (ECF subfamily)
MVVGQLERARVGESPTARTVDAVPTFDAFYLEHRDRIARALGLNLRDTELGVDAADEAFARACQRWSQVSRYDNPEGWVYRVAINWARSWLRRKRRERERQPLLISDASTEDRVLDVDLERAIAQLSDDHRSVVVARFFLDWSVNQTADALGLAPGTVKSRLSRALQQLENELGAEVTP